MATPYLSQIQLFAFTFAPRGWAFCSGSLLAIQQNTALFSLLGTQYGGNGSTTFGLPNLASRAAAGQGQGPGLSPRDIGEIFGSQNVTLIGAEMPAHGHGLVLYAQNNPASRSGSPATGNALSAPSNAAATAFLPGGTAGTTFAPNMVQATGGGQPHNNQQPYLGLGFCIALQGIFPARN